MGMTITDQQCDEILMRDLEKFEATLDEALEVPVADHEYDALLSIMFNVGPQFATSTAIKRLNQGDRRGCADAIMMWNKPPEIIGRRKTEQSQFLTPYD
jgi:lysozyme